MSYRATLQIILGAGALVGLDVATKEAAQTFFREPVVIIPHVLQFVVSFNPGIAFSIPIPNIVMLFVAPAVAIGVTFYMSRMIDLELAEAKVSLMLITAGAAGNFVDRIKLGRVVDFIDFSFWPSFNLADSYITVAAFLIVIFYGRIMKDHSNHGR